MFQGLSRGFLNPKSPARTSTAQGTTNGRSVCQAAAPKPQAPSADHSCATKARITITRTVVASLQKEIKELDALLAQPTRIAAHHVGEQINRQPTPALKTQEGQRVCSEAKPLDYQTAATITTQLEEALIQANTSKKEGLLENELTAITQAREHLENLRSMLKNACYEKYSITQTMAHVCRQLAATPSWTGRSTIDDLNDFFAATHDQLIQPQINDTDFETLYRLVLELESNPETSGVDRFITPPITDSIKDATHAVQDQAIQWTEWFVKETKKRNLDSACDKAFIALYKIVSRSIEGLGNPSDRLEGYTLERCQREIELTETKLRLSKEAPLYCTDRLTEKDIHNIRFYLGSLYQLLGNTIHSDDAYIKAIAFHRDTHKEFPYFAIISYIRRLRLAPTEARFISIKQELLELLPSTYAPYQAAIKHLNQKGLVNSQRDQEITRKNLNTIFKCHIEILMSEGRQEEAEKLVQEYTGFEVATAAPKPGPTPKAKAKALPKRKTQTNRRGRKPNRTHHSKAEADRGTTQSAESLPTETSPIHSDDGPSTTALAKRAAREALKQKALKEEKKAAKQGSSLQESTCTTEGTETKQESPEIFLGASCFETFNKFWVKNNESTNPEHQTYSNRESISTKELKELIKALGGSYQEKEHSKAVLSIENLLSTSRLTLGNQTFHLLSKAPKLSTTFTIPTGHGRGTHKDSKNKNLKPYLIRQIREKLVHLGLTPECVKQHR